MATRSLDSQNVWGRGVAINGTHTSLRMIEIVLSLIYAQLFLCLVSHNKQSDFHFDKNNFFISVLTRSL